MSRKQFVQLLQNHNQKISSMKKITTLGTFLVLLCLMETSLSANQQCSNPQYIIPYQPLNQIFDTGLSQVRQQKQLVSLLQNPSVTTAKDYLLSLAPYSAPLFAMAAVTLVIFIATIIQVLCFNSCGKQCCGNEINERTYNVCCFRAFVAVFLILAFFVILISIAALILNSDLQQSVTYTTCNTQNIVYETYNGNNNQSMPWSGTNNFQNNIQIFSASIQNSIPYLIQYFSSTNPGYNQVIDSSSGSAYANSQVFNCQNSNSTIDCPFPSSYQNCSTPYQATFNAQFCNVNFNGSAANLIANQMNVNSSKWRNNTLGIASTLGTLNTDSSSVQALNQSILSFTNSLGSYQTSIQQGFGSASSIQWAIQIAFYSFYSLILATSLLSIVTLCMAYFCNNFKCRYFMYVYWYMFFFLSLLLFIDSGFFNATSIFAFDTCSAYPYYFGNYTNFQNLDFNNSQLGNIFSTCFFTNKTTSMFSAFSNTTILTQFGTLYSQYQNAMPSNQFSSVVSAIQNQIMGYAANPNTVIIQNVSASQQPYMALYQLNLQANYSAPLTTQSCHLTQDNFTFNVANCGLYLTNQPIGTNCCIVLYSPNISSTVNGRVNAFNSQSCSIDANDYQSRVNALISYGSSISFIAFQLSPLSQSNNQLLTYQSAYFNYYSTVLNFYNSPTQQVFNSFFVPYVSLQEGSGCPFITTSINGVVDITCDQLQPYINALSALNIVCSVFVFVLFILSYFLTTRLEFYELLQGNFDNAGIIKVQPASIQQKYDLETSSRNQELLTIRTGEIGNSQL